MHAPSRTRCSLADLLRRNSFQPAGRRQRNLTGRHASSAGLRSIRAERAHDTRVIFSGGAPGDGSALILPRGLCVRMITVSASD